jgi:hypothetical protein
MNESDFEAGEDERDLDTLIEGMTLEALRFVNLNAPHELLAADSRRSTMDAGYGVEPGIIPGTQIGVFSSVEKFLRLVCARCSYWSKPVYDVIQEGTPSWDKLSNKFLTGTVEDPRVSVGKVSTGLQIDDYDNAEVRMYCIPVIKEGFVIAEIYYMKQPEWDNQGQLRISYLLQDAFYYYLAYLVLMALGDQRAQIALQQAYPLMGLKEEKDD